MIQTNPNNELINEALTALNLLDTSTLESLAEGNQYQRLFRLTLTKSQPVFLYGDPAEITPETIATALIENARHQWYQCTVGGKTTNNADEVVITFSLVPWDTRPKELILRNALRCGICGESADRYSNRFGCQTNPGHMADLVTGLFSDLTRTT